MTRRHPTVGGKQRRVKDSPPKPQPTGMIILTCDKCSAEYMTAVEVGRFDIYKPCDCGAMIRVRGRYDGYNVFVAGSIEAVVTDDKSII